MVIILLLMVELLPQEIVLVCSGMIVLLDELLIKFFHWINYFVTMFDALSMKYVIIFTWRIPSAFLKHVLQML